MIVVWASVFAKAMANCHLLIIVPWEWRKHWQPLAMTTLYTKADYYSIWDQSFSLSDIDFGKEENFLFFKWQKKQDMPRVSCLYLTSDFRELPHVTKKATSSSKYIGYNNQSLLLWIWLGNRLLFVMINQSRLVSKCHKGVKSGPISYTLNQIRKWKLEKIWLTVVLVLLSNKDVVPSYNSRFRRDPGHGRALRFSQQQTHIQTEASQKSNVE